MTKTLTEQWRDRTLPDGYYYVTSKKWGMLIDRYRDQINDCGHKWRGFDNCQGMVDEVIAPVPSYEEYKKLRKLPLKCFQLEEDNSALVVINKEMSQKIERLEFDNEALEMAHNEGKEINAELVSKTEQLEKKLKIAKKALEDILNDGDDYWDKDKAQEALKEMEGVK